MEREADEPKDSQSDDGDASDGNIEKNFHVTESFFVADSCEEDFDSMIIPATPDMLIPSTQEEDIMTSKLESTKDSNKKENVQVLEETEGLGMPSLNVDETVINHSDDDSNDMTQDLIGIECTQPLPTTQLRNSQGSKPANKVDEDEDSDWQLKFSETQETQELLGSAGKRVVNEIIEKDVLGESSISLMEEKDCSIEEESLLRRPTVEDPLSEKPDTSIDKHQMDGSEADMSQSRLVERLKEEYASLSHDFRASTLKQEKGVSTSTPNNGPNGRSKELTRVSTLPSEKPPVYELGSSQNAPKVEISEIPDSPEQYSENHCDLDNISMKKSVSPVKDAVSLASQAEDISIKSRVVSEVGHVKSSSRMSNGECEVIEESPKIDTVEIIDSKQSTVDMMVGIVETVDVIDKAVDQKILVELDTVELVSTCEDTPNVEVVEKSEPAQVVKESEPKVNGHNHDKDIANDENNYDKDETVIEVKRRSQEHLKADEQNISTGTSRSDTISNEELSSDSPVSRQFGFKTPKNPMDLPSSRLSRKNKLDKSKKLIPSTEKSSASLKIGTVTDVNSLRQLIIAHVQNPQTTFPSIPNEMFAWKYEIVDGNVYFELKIENQSANEGLRRESVSPHLPSSSSNSLHSGEMADISSSSGKSANSTHDQLESNIKSSQEESAPKNAENFHALFRKKEIAIPAVPSSPAESDFKDLKKSPGKRATRKTEKAAETTTASRPKRGRPKKKGPKGLTKRKKSEDTSDGGENTRSRKRTRRIMSIIEGILPLVHTESSSSLQSSSGPTTRSLRKSSSPRSQESKDASKSPMTKKRNFAVNVPLPPDSAQVNSSSRSQDSKSASKSPRTRKQNFAVDVPLLPDPAQDNQNSQQDNSSTHRVLPGQRVMARWRDDCYYPGSVQSQVLENRWQVLFDDGSSMAISEDQIVKVSVLQPGTSVLAQSSDDYCDPGIVRGHFRQGAEVGYEVELDTGVTKRFPRISVILSSDQAKLLSDSPPACNSPATSTIKLENIQDGKRKRKQVPSFLPSSAKKSPRTSLRTKPDSNLDTTDSERSNIDAVGARGKRTTKRKAAEVGKTKTADILTHKKNIFKDFAFIVTGGNNKGNAEEVAESASSYFDKDEFISFLISHGGLVVEKFEELQKCNKKTVYLLSNRYVRTMKFLQCLATAVPCIYEKWARCCVYRNEIQSIVDFRIPAGVSIMKNPNGLIEWHGRTNIFKGLKIALTSAEESPFVDNWAPLLLSAKANFVLKWLLPGTKPGTPARVDVLITNSQCPLSIIQSAKKRKIPIVSSEWIIQCLINGKRLPFDAHSKFQYNSE